MGIVEATPSTVVMIKMMLLIKKKLKKNLKSKLRIQSTLRRISLLINIMKKNLVNKNQCLFLIRNTNQNKKNTV